jgi:peptidoglycan/LPS O-acetylase OafA/YrhL
MGQGPEQPSLGSAPSAGQSHVASLDGVRFFAFFGVFVFHALQNNAVLAPWAAHGALGVQVFFVLSGFLIGDILLSLRERTTVPLGRRLRTFYVRRALRIFPLYYLVLVLIALLPSIGITVIGGRELFVWNATYLTNVAMYLGQGFGGQSHFWSLAVEEHFYLVAPLLMLTVPSRRLTQCFVVIWIVCAALRGYEGPDKRSLEWLSPMQFDCMTVGIAAAMLARQGTFLGLGLAGALRLAKASAAAALVTMALAHLHVPGARFVEHAAEQWLVSVASAGLILSLWNADDSPWARFFALRPLAYLGKISYGLYVFHLPCIVVVSTSLANVMKHGSAIPALALTVLLAMTSWRLFESPINDLKRFFPYGGGSQSRLRMAA